MTTKQAIRSLLIDTDKFIIGDYNGQKWQCPDAFIAVTTDIYSQYKPKKSQVDNMHQFDHIDNQPKMASILERDGNYAVATTGQEYPEQGSIDIVAGDTVVSVNKRYFDFMQALYPMASLLVDQAYKYSPVKVVENDVTVALIMPLTR